MNKFDSPYKKLIFVTLNPGIFLKEEELNSIDKLMDKYINEYYNMYYKILNYQ